MRRVPRSVLRAGGWALAGSLAGAAAAQSDDAPGVGREYSITPSVSISATATDNSRTGGGSGEADLITQATAGVSVRKTAGRVRGSLDYSLTGSVHARESSDNEFQNRLNAFGTAELVDNRAFIDANASISRQLASAFGTRLSDNSLGSRNQADVVTYRLSPYVRGELGSLASYEGRLAYSGSKSDAGALSDSNVTSGSLGLSGTPGGFVGWSLTGARQIYDYKQGREIESDTLRGVLSFAFDPQFTFFLIGGRESNNFTNLEKESRSTSGFGLTWLPTERTRLSAERERRFFGNSHSVAFEHRFPRSAVRFSSGRSLQSDAERFATASLGTVFDLFFLQFASIEPDPVRRAQLVNSFLQANGISPTTIVTGGFLTSGVTVDRRQELSFSLQGLRDTLTFTGFQSDSRRADTVTAGVDDFASSSFVKQRGLTVNWARRLTPISSLNVGLAYQRAEGDQSSLETDLQSITATWSTRLGERSSFSVSLRRSEFDSSSDPYDENAVTAALSMRF